MKRVFSKRLSANDVGATGGHQAGILIPKSEADLLAFLPALNPGVKNPDAWIECVDENLVTRRFRFIYYNNRLHDLTGTRNEYRLTYMTAYFREVGAKEGDSLEISRNDDDIKYTIRLVRALNEPSLVREEEQGYRIKIRSAWRRVH